MYSTWVWDLVTSYPDFRFQLKSKDFADYVSDTEHLYFSLLGKSSKWPQWKEVYLLWKGIFRRIRKLYMQTIQAMAVIFWRGFWPCTKMADILMSLWRSMKTDGFQFIVLFWPLLVLTLKPCSGKTGTMEKKRDRSSWLWRECCQRFDRIRIFGRNWHQQRQCANFARGIQLFAGGVCQEIVRRFSERCNQW